MLDILNCYDTIAEIYDDGAFQLGFPEPNQLLSIFKEFKVSFEVKLAEMGAGTGLVGKFLHDNGYKNISGFEPSDGMRKVLEEKKVYEDSGDLSLEVYPLPEKYKEKFDVVFAIGVFFDRHVSAKGVEDLLFFCKKEGFIVFNYREDQDSLGNYWKMVKTLETQKRIKVYRLQRYFKYTSKDSDDIKTNWVTGDVYGYMVLAKKL